MGTILTRSFQNFLSKADCRLGLPKVIWRSHSLPTTKLNYCNFINFNSLLIMILNP